ncbi:MAG TPA: response regulator transcription factor [Candidatus Obscuribacterales bacterium]
MANIFYIHSDKIKAVDLQKWKSCYDLIIVEFESIDNEAVDLCRSIRKQGVHTPILVIASESATGQRVDILDAGADDILSRPLHSPELSARIRALVRRPKFIMPRHIDIGGITLDTAVKSAFQGDKPIDLSLCEYALLEILARNANRVMSLEEIVDKVSSFGSDVCPSFIRVLVHRLRLKLHWTQHSIVENVRGRGYVVRAQL